MTDAFPDHSIDRRQFLRGLGAAGALAAAPFALSACGGAATDSGKKTGGGAGKTLKVGFIVPVGGVYQTISTLMINGFKLYLDTHGNKLGGRPVELVHADEGASVAAAQQAGQRLIYNDHVEFVAGVLKSDAAVGLRTTFDTGKVPLIIANANVTEVSTTAKSPYVYRTSASFYQQGGSAGKWYYDTLAKENVWIVADDYVGGHDIANAFKDTFTKAGGTVGGQLFTPFQKTTDFGPYLVQARNGGAKGIFAFFGGSEAIAFVKQYESFGLGAIPLAGQGSLFDSAVLGAEGDAGYNKPATGNYYVPTLDNPVNKEFVAQYTKKYGNTPAYYSCSSYDAAQLIDLALTKTDGSTSDAKELISAMENPGEFKSPRGEMTMDPDTHNPIQHFYVYENVKTAAGATDEKIIADVGVFKQPAA
jgi:branched-chain amino acid transport system substrate-binding protein